MLTTDELRQRVQRSLTSGELFPAPRTVWAGSGSGRLCAVCSSTLPKDEIEYELAGGINGSVAAHPQCYAIWQAESEAAAARDG